MSLLQRPSQKGLPTVWRVFLEFGLDMIEDVLLVSESVVVQPPCHQTLGLHVEKSDQVSTIEVLFFIWRPLREEEFPCSLVPFSDYSLQPLWLALRSLSYLMLCEFALLFLFYLSEGDVLKVTF